MDAHKIFIFSCLMLVHFQHRCEASSVSVETLHIRSDISSRFANTLITSRVRNTGQSARQLTFDVQLPKTAFIANFSMTIDGIVYYGNVKEKQEALKQYEKARKRGESAGLIKQQARDANKFKVSVNVAAKNSVTFNLTYQELLRRKLGLYDHVIYLNPGQTVPDMKVDVYIREMMNIEELKQPVLKDVMSNEERAIPAVVDWITDQSVHIGYYPTQQQQEELFTGESLVVPTNSFTVQYDVERTHLDAGQFMAVDGYFIHFVAPKVSKPIPKKIVFVLDLSGSMQGRKMQQMKEAMVEILQDLNDVDTFTVVGFHDRNLVWLPHLVPVKENDNIQKAKEWVEDLYTLGGTNIGSGILGALDILNRDQSEAIPMIFFLTDGEPTSGITDLDTLLSKVTGKNKFGVRLMSLGFGDGADQSLLQQMSAANFGIARKVYEASDSALQVSTFYDEVSSPVLADIKIKYLSSAVDNKTVTTNEFNTLFNGSELVIAGKINSAGGPFELSLEGQIADDYLLVGKTVESQMTVPTQPSTFSDLSGFTERVWAYLTIQQLLEKTVLANPTETERIKQEVTRLSLKYGFVTPYTSMVVTKPQVKKPDPKYDQPSDGESNEEDNKTPSGANSSPWKPSSGYADNDPHFIIALKGLSLPLCFDMMGEDKEYWRLLSDPLTGVQVNGKLFTRVQNSMKTYFSTIIVKTRDYVLKIKPNSIQIDQTIFQWRNNLMLQWQGKEIGFFGDDNVTLHVTKDTTFVIMRHTQESKMAASFRYLGFYMNNATGLSNQTSGLLGDFLKRFVLQSDVRAGQRGHYVSKMAIYDTMTSKLETIEAKLRHRRDMEHDVIISCWQIKPGHLLDHLKKHLLHGQRLVS